MALKLPRVLGREIGVVSLPASSAPATGSATHHAATHAELVRGRGRHRPPREAGRVYYTDRGIEELADRRGEEQLSLAWLAERLRDFVDLNPGFETPIDRLASWLARLDDEDDR